MGPEDVRIVAKRVTKYDRRPGKRGRDWRRERATRLGTGGGRDGQRAARTKGRGPINHRKLVNRCVVRPGTIEWAVAHGEWPPKCDVGLRNGENGAKGQRGQRLPAEAW